MCFLKSSGFPVWMADRLNRIITCGEVSIDRVFSLLATKIALKKQVDDIEEARKKAAEELKPEGEETEEMKQEWNRRFAEFFNRYLEEEVTVEVKKVSADDLYELSRDSELTMQQMEVLNCLVAG